MGAWFSSSERSSLGFIGSKGSKGSKGSTGVVRRIKIRSAAKYK